MTKGFKERKKTDDSKIFQLLRYISPHKEITNFHKSIIIGLITFNGKGAIFPKLSELAKRINSKDISGVSKGLNHLERLGVIQIEKRKQKSSIYKFNYDILDKIDDADEDKSDKIIKEANELLNDNSKTTFLESKYADFEIFGRKFIELNSSKLKEDAEEPFGIYRECLRIYEGLAVWNEGETVKTLKQWEELMVTFFTNDNRKYKSINSSDDYKLKEMLGEEKYDKVMEKAGEFSEKLEREARDNERKLEAEVPEGHYRNDEGYIVENGFYRDRETGEIKPRRKLHKSMFHR
ncbi:MAG: hypothetical protein NTY74_10845 [Ignavibacteriae bacterium]|nr:hypothetical protein [Ignavibacteriota bacterium]